MNESFAWYSFEGIKGDNPKLHITSHKFDEPTLLLALQETETVLTIHGKKGSDDEFLEIGGLDTAFGHELRVALQHQGFIVREAKPGYRSELKAASGMRQHRNLQSWRGGYDKRL